MCLEGDSGLHGDDHHLPAGRINEKIPTWAGPVWLRGGVHRRSAPKPALKAGHLHQNRGHRR